MTLKKRLLTASAAAVFAVSVLPFAAFADDEPAPCEKKAVTAYLYGMEKSESLDCLFKTDLPEIPYIDFEAYADRLYTVDFKTSAKGDVYTVSGNDMTFTADTAKDTLTIDGFDENYSQNVVVVEQDSVSDYAKNSPAKTQGEKKPVTLDFSKYNIDLIGDSGKLYLPLNTLSDLFACTYRAAEYVGGDLYFLQTVMHSQNNDGYFDRSSIYNETERSQTLADYTYNELCFLFDHIYGKPSKCELSESIAAKGFDKTLDTYSDTTRKAKKYLQSTSRAEFYMGVVLLSKLLEDGGHTAFSASLFIDKFSDDGALSQTPLIKAFDKASEAEPEIAAYILEQMMSTPADEEIKELRAEKLKDVPLIKKWDADKAAFYIKGKTALFYFDQFMNSVVKDLKWSLDYAAQTGCKNFVIDLAANTGGEEEVAHYINTIMSNKKNRTNVNVTRMCSSMTGNIIINECALDLDLNGKIDDADKDVYYDFNFAVLTTKVSYSCGNLVPCMAKEEGVAVIGETSGGGTCMIAKNYFADSGYCTISSLMSFLRSDLTDVDSGAAVDYDLTKKNADGETDYSGLYDFDKLNECINAYYGVQPPESSQPESSKPESSSQPESSQPASSRPAYDGPPLTGHTGAAVSVAVVLIGVAALAVIKKKQD